MKSRYNPVLVAVILLGLACSLWLNWTRYKIEQRNDTVEMAMEYEDLLKLAALEGLPEDDVLLQFKKAGINSLMIFDTTLDRLTKKGDIRCAAGGELRQAALLGADRGVFAAVSPADIEEQAAYLAVGSKPQVLDDVAEDLRLRYGADRVEEISASPRIVKIIGSTALVPEDKYDEPLGILQAPLGLPAQDMQRAAALGFNVIVRPQNYINVNKEKIDSIFARIAKAGVPVHAYMPCGKDAVGYPDKLDYIGQKLREAGMKLIMLEHYTQLRFAQINGLVELAEYNEYRAARSYVIDGLEQKKISVDTALRRWALTDEERNIRVNYIRPFMLPVKGQSLLKTNLQYVRDIKANVEGRGYIIGEAAVFNAADGADYAPYFPGKLYLLPIAAAIVAAMVLYAEQLFGMRNKYQLGLWALGSAAAAALLLAGRGLLTRQLLALATASVLPVLSMSVVFDIWDKNKTDANGLLKIIYHGIWQLALAVALSLIGAAFLSAILTDSRFLLEIDIYRGVKLTFMLPVVLTTLLYLKRYDLLRVAGGGVKALVGRVNSLLDTGLTFKHIAVLCVLLFIAFYFVGRSGHTGGVPVPALELKMRAFLEQIMYARPREKEFMIGHPAFFLAVLAAYRCAPRWWQFVLACGAVIGQGSLVQTFCHMRTPVIMSFLRAVDGYAVGVVFGAVCAVVLGCLLPLLIKMRRRYLEQ